MPAASNSGDSLGPNEGMTLDDGTRVAAVFIVNIVVFGAAVMIFLFTRRRKMKAENRGRPLTRNSSQRVNSRWISQRPSASPSDRSEDEENAGLLQGRTMLRVPQADQTALDRITSSREFFLALLRISDEEMTRRSGLEATMYLKFQRLSGMAIGACSIFAIFLLLPVNKSGGRGLAFPGCYTVSNVVPGDVLWVHASITYIFTIITYIAVFRFWHEFQDQRKQYRENSPLSMLTVHVSGIPKDVTETQEVIDFLIRTELIMEGEALSAHAVLDLRELNRLERRRDELQKELEKCEEYQLRTGKKMRKFVFSRCQLVEADIHINNELSSVKGRLQAWHANGVVKGTGQAFVSLRSPAAVTRVRYRYKASGLKVQPACEPYDIVWNNLYIPSWERRIRSIVVNISLFTFIFFYTSPFAMLSAAKDTINNNPVLKEMTHASGVVVVTFLPSLALLGLTIVLPHIFKGSAELERLSTLTQQRRSALTKMFMYFVLSLVVMPGLLLTSVTPTSLTAAVKAVNSPVEIILLLGSVFSYNSGSFYIIFIIQAAFLWSALDLLLVWDRIAMFWQRLTQGRGRSAAIDAMAGHAGEKERLEFSFPYEYSWALTVFCMSLSFSTMFPLVLPFGTLFFFIKYCVDKQNLLSAYPHHGDSDGRIPRSVISFLLSCVLMLHIYNASYFFLVGETEMFLAVICLIPITFIVYLYIEFKEKRYDMLGAAKQRTLSSDMDPETELMIVEMSRQYVHPSLRASLPDVSENHVSPLEKLGPLMSEGGI